MKRICHLKVRGFILAAAFSAGLGFGTSASAQVRRSYLIDLNSKTVTDIGTLGGTLQPMLVASTTPGRWWVILTRLEARPCFHHRPRRDGHERPWHLRWYC